MQKIVIEVTFNETRETFVAAIQLHGWEIGDHADSVFAQCESFYEDKARMRAEHIMKTFFPCVKEYEVRLDSEAVTLQRMGPGKFAAAS